MILEIHLQTKKRDEMIDITAQVEALLENVQEGLVVVYSSHTTAGITINENADPDVQRDILRRLDEICLWSSNPITTCTSFFLWSFQDPSAKS
ncbi:MAG: secondary thiamine-phosphate synthase enzyme YjbQ [Desulfosporosinus sp.]